MDFADPKNNTTPPSNGDCCQGIGDFLRLSPQCVCYLVKTNLTDVFGIEIDRGKALNLPKVCKKKLPVAELSKCSGKVSSKCLAPVAEKLIPCVDYVDPASKKVKPPSNGVCCSGLKGFLNEDFDCLCSLVNVKPGDFPIPIDRLKILQLPGLCNAIIPSFKCSGNKTLPAPENNCLMPLVDKLGSCVNFVDPTTNSTKPLSNGACCSGLKSFLKDDFSCLCSLVNVKPGDYPVPIDRSKILQLPGICNATIPSFKCSGNNTLLAPENACLTPVVSKLGSCINNVDPTGNKTKPPSNGDCCRGLQTFLKEDVRCLCSLINVKPGDYPVSIDRERVLSLPGACNATIPSVKCAGSITSPAKENVCLMPAVNNLAPCVDYVDPASNLSESIVTADCCSGLNNFVNTQPRCVCNIIVGESDDYPIPIDKAKALSIITRCNVSIPTDQCAGSDSPIDAPRGNSNVDGRPRFSPSVIALFWSAFLAIVPGFI